MLIKQINIILADTIITTPEDLALIIHEFQHDINGIYLNLGQSYLGLMRNSAEPEGFFKAYQLITEGLSNNIAGIIKSINYLKDNPGKSPVIGDVVFVTSESAITFLKSMDETYSSYIDKLNTYLPEMEELLKKGK